MRLKHRVRDILRKEYPSEKHWKAFVYWWLAANGYESERAADHVNFVDGWRDGGIDAIAWPLEKHGRDELLVIQSKYFGQEPTEGDLKRFREAVQAINGPLADFHEWLESCREELHLLYRRLRDERRRLRYIIIAPCKFSSSFKRHLRHEGIEVHDLDVLESLERNYAEGRTPRLEELRISSATAPRLIAGADRTRVWIFTITARELGRLFERHDNLLFAGNIRYALRGDTARRVRSGMLETLESNSEEFVFSHNGITITGDSIKRRGRTLVLGSATIVNGAQTVSYFGSPRVMKHLNGSARVIAKFVEVDDAELLNDIESKVAFRSNNQNKVDPSDLMIELPSLVSLQRYFRRHGIHLERKKGEQKLHFGQPGISKERLAQVLAAAESPEGAVKGKRKQELFADSAHRLFSDYDASDKARSEAMAWARIDTIFRSTINEYSNKKRRKRAQIAQLASLATFHHALKATNLKQRVLRAMGNWESSQEPAKMFLERSFKAVMAALLQCSSHHKKNEPAFYKAASSVIPTIDRAVWRCRKKIRQYYETYLTH
jgi:hypothetical protein